MLQVKKKKKIYKNTCLFIKKEKQRISFRNLKTGQQWNFKKLNDTAADAQVDGFQVMFGFPKVTQVIYPQQTIRLNSGWQMDKLPDNTMMHIYPSNALIQNDLIATPQSVDSSKQGGQLIQVLMNNSSKPIQISLDSDQNVQIHKLNQNTLQKSLKLDFGQLLRAGLGIAQHILPFFA